MRPGGPEAGKVLGAKKGKSKPCYRGYRLGISQNGFDTEFLGDFDNDPGPDGKTFDLADSATLGPLPHPPERPWAWLWLDGNDDTGVTLGEPRRRSAPTVSTTTATADRLRPDAQAASRRAVRRKAGLGGRGAPGQALPRRAAGRPRRQQRGGQCPLADGAEWPAAGRQFRPPPHLREFAQNRPTTAPRPAEPGAGVSHTLGPGLSYDMIGNGTDAAGISDCAAGYDTSATQDRRRRPPVRGLLRARSRESQSHVPVCLFHGIDGDLSLTLRDAILVRVGNGVKARNPQGALFNNQVSPPCRAASGVPEPGLGLGRCAGAWEVVPLRQHAPRGVRRWDGP